MLGRLILGFALLLPQGLGAQSGAVACPITAPSNPPFVLPAPYWQNASDGAFWYGSEALWTMLPVDGRWRGWDEGKGYTTKLVWWRRGFDWRKEPEPKLIVTGRRLDVDAPLIFVTRANAVFSTTDRPAIMIGINIPAAGCWELTGHYRSQILSYVVSVEP